MRCCAIRARGARQVQHAISSGIWRRKQRKRLAPTRARAVSAYYNDIGKARMRSTSSERRGGNRTKSRAVRSDFVSPPRSEGVEWPARDGSRAIVPRSGSPGTSESSNLPEGADEGWRAQTRCGRPKPALGPKPSTRVAVHHDRRRGRGGLAHVRRAHAGEDPRVIRTIVDDFFRMGSSTSGPSCGTSHRNGVAGTPVARCYQHRIDSPGFEFNRERGAPQTRPREGTERRGLRP